MVLARAFRSIHRDPPFFRSHAGITTVHHGLGASFGAYDAHCLTPIPIVLNVDEPSDPDIDAFIRGEADTFPEFAPIRPVLHHGAANAFPSYELGNSGARLIRFAHRFGTYDWNHDPNHPEKMRLLERYNSAEPADPIPMPFDVLWRWLFAAVREDRFGSENVANKAIALVRIANELRRRLQSERAGGDSKPADSTVEPYVADRIRRSAPDGCSVITGSTPVVAFGDPSVATVATLGLNPSRIEFTDSGQLLGGPQRRLASLGSLGVESLSDANAETVGRVVGACRRYFWRRPYRRWFDQLETILSPLGFSYYDGTACHLDLVQSATDPTWAKLSDYQRQRLLNADVPYVRDQLDSSAFRFLLINGSSVRGWAAASLGIEFANVAGVAQDGTMTSFAVGKFNGKVPVLAWSTNLQSSWGVTRGRRNAIASRVSELVAQGW
jgi:hypothetical protein